MEWGLVALWLALYLAVLYLGGLLATFVFPRFADRGLGVAIPLGLAVVWLVAFFVGHVSLAAGTWGGVLVLVGLATLARKRGATIDPRRFAETAAVFALAFGFMVAIRAVDPAIVPLGGEKFLDFGLLRSLLREPSLPVEDLWFAGEPMAYYYGGHLLAAVLTRVTGTAPAYAYNLALAGFYAMLVTAVYGLAGSVGAHRGLPRRLAGGFGALFVGLASNLATPGSYLLWLLPGGIASWLTDAAGIEPPTLAANGPDAFSYWDASRVIQDSAADFVTYEPAAAYVINEFPLFSWLNGDLHAHMTSTPFLMLAAALCFAYYRTPADDLRRRRALLLGALPALAGMIAVTSTWSFPTVGGLAALTVALVPASPWSLLPGTVPAWFEAGRWRREGSRLGLGLLAGALVVAIGLVWSGPFWLVSASSRQVAILPDRSGLGELLVVHGTFLLAFAPYLYLRWADALDRTRARIAALLIVAGIVVAAVVDLAVLGLTLPILLGGWALARRPVLEAWFDAEQVAESEGSEGRARRSGRRGFETVLLVGGAGLVTIVEFVFVRENVGRMNTVFKTYMQVWVLWATAAGVALAFVVDRWPPDADGWRPLAARGFAALLLVTASVYAGFALSGHFTSQSDIARTDDPTLDGLAYLDIRHPEEAPAIRWLANRSGRPPIVTAAPASYTWNADEGDGASAPASLTGLPTVAGWTHERQYRNASVYATRVEHVRRIYSGSREWQVYLLDRYDVGYVYVGPAERARYDNITVGRLQGVTVAQRWKSVTIYRVTQSNLAR